MFETWQLASTNVTIFEKDWASSKTLRRSWSISSILDYTYKSVPIRKRLAVLDHFGECSINLKFYLKTLELRQNVDRFRACSISFMLYSISFESYSRTIDRPPKQSSMFDDFRELLDLNFMPPTSIEASSSLAILRPVYHGLVSYDLSLFILFYLIFL